MEYRVEKLLEGLQNQREALVNSLIDLNENLPNYSLKINDINLQISNIDGQTYNLITSLRDLEVLKENNQLTIKTQKQ